MIIKLTYSNLVKSGQFAFILIVLVLHILECTTKQSRKSVAFFTLVR